MFPTFVKFLKGGVEEQELLEQFRDLSEHLKQNGPFLKGSSVSSGDLALGPKLYHVLTALKTFKVRSSIYPNAAKTNDRTDPTEIDPFSMQDFDLPDDYKPVKDYMAKLKSRPSWQNTKYSEDLVNAGWKAHLEKS